jgi:Asp/Glu/hydantoin racemase
MAPTETGREGMRIWYQSAVEMAGATPYRAALEAHVARVADPGTVVEVHGVDPGTWGGLQPSQLFGCPAVFLAALGPALLRNAVRAERAGYDAFIIGTYIEPFLRELRSAVDIPVVSSLEATLLAGCATAHTIGLITLNRPLLWSLQTSIERHRLGARVGPLLVMQPELLEAEIIGLLARPEAYLARFTETARQAIAAQADAIIPAEGILAEIVAAAGITQVDGAAVLDGIGIPVAQAEMMVKLQRRTGLRVGRAWHHARPAPEILDSFITRLA